MPFFGVHESIADGFDNAVLAAARHGFDTVQIFSKNSNRWAAKPISEAAAESFRDTLEKTGLKTPLIHDSYLINPASPREELREKSIMALIDELNRADRLGISSVVMHPGAFTTGTEESGIVLVADSLDRVFEEAAAAPMILIETTAGQGSYLGRRFEQIAAVLERSKYPDRLGVCLDTCHIFAAGYSFATPEEYGKMMEEFDSLIGIKRLKAFHLNDSAGDLGSHVDRHAGIGFGKIGKEPFGFFINDPRFADTPMYMETPKGIIEIDGAVEDLDIVNLRTLKGLLK